MSEIQWKKSNKIINYEEALALMEQRVDDVAQNKARQLIWFLEHKEIYTAGTSASASELLENKFPIYQVGRGGKYTYHGPGQRIVYFILNLREVFDNPDLRQFIFLLEQIIIETLEIFNIKSFRCKDRIGVWVDKNNEEKKIAAIGIRIRKWVCYHGIAINVNPCLANYSGIVPCGIEDYGVTSLADLGSICSMAELDDILKRKIKEIFNIR